MLPLIPPLIRGVRGVETDGNVIYFVHVDVFLTQCFISANHKLIKVLVQQTGEFECLTPSEFVSKYLN